MGEIKHPLLGNDPPGSTPLEEEDLEGLIPKFITNRRDLFDAEFRNINGANTKYLISNRKFKFTIANLYKIHKDMFSNVWSWAGTKRKTNKNIGVDKTQIDIELKKLEGDLIFWEKSDFNPIEIATRLHFRLVQIHSFNNGNGRWARFVTNIYLKQKIGSTIVWPEDQMFIATEFRRKYISAIHKAIQHDFVPLIKLHQDYLK